MDRASSGAGDRPARARRAMLTAGAVAAALAAAAAARWLPAKAVVAHLNSEAVQRQWGVERAVSDPETPRVLVVRVSGHWYEVPERARRAKAAEWLADWRRNVAEGAVAVLDAATGRPVVQFDAAGAVVGVADAPAR